LASTATDVPLMVYNNPPIYSSDITSDILEQLADCDTIVLQGQFGRHAAVHRYPQPGG